jgi:predicted ribosomally synthesized peptide with nif11-like leader
MSQEKFEQFRHVVLQDLTLQERLRESEDRETFVKLLVHVGSEHGYNFTPEDVENALRDSRRAWIERWLDT